MTAPILRVPGDKSISHRALMFAALATGESRITGLLTGADVQSTAAALRALGCSVPTLSADDPVCISGVGLRGLRAPAAPIDCGNSGTTVRLLLGILAGQPIEVVLSGDESLQSRPMRRVTEPLARMGATFEELGAPDRLPLRMHGGRLQPFEYASPHASAQVKSALLLAGLTGGVRVALTEPHRSRDHTERMLRAQGVPVARWGDSNVHGVVLDPVEQLAPLDLRVPGDFSSAAYFLALGALRSGRELRVAGVGINPTRTGMLDVLARMGVRVERVDERMEGREPVADLVVRGRPLRATTIEPHEIAGLIDEIPVLAVLAARASGETQIRGAQELRVKETDRIHALVHNLRAIGVDVTEADDGMTIRGTDAPLRGRVAAFGDHRIAMAFGVLGAAERARDANDTDPGAIEVDDPDVVAISFPTFWSQLREVAG